MTNLRRRSKGAGWFCNLRGTAKQWIKEGKNAVNWTRLSCHDFVDNQVQMQLFVLAYNLGNFLWEVAAGPSPKSTQDWSRVALPTGTRP